MSEDERQLSGLLHEVVPDPEVVVDFDDLRRARRRRLRTPLTIAAAAAVVLAVSVTWWAASPRDDGIADVAQPSPSATIKPPSSAENGCPATEPRPDGQVAMIDYVDFVQFEGRQYVAGTDGAVGIAPVELWSAVGEVTCTISRLAESGDRSVVGPFLDSNAAYLPVGTELRAVSGFDTSCRIAARVDGEIRVYLAQHDVGGISEPRNCALAPSPGAPTMTRCDRLPSVPQGIEIDTSLDEEHGLFEYTYGNDNTTFRIAYRDDPTCRDRADVMRLVNHSPKASAGTG